MGKPCYICIMTLLIFSLCICLKGTTVYAAEGLRIEIMTEDHTPQSGSTENEVGFHPGNFSYGALDQLADYYGDHREYKELVPYSGGMWELCDDSSVKYRDADLYIRDGIVYNANGSAYADGRFFRIRFIKTLTNTEEEQEPENTRIDEIDIGYAAGRELAGSQLSPLEYAEQIDYSQNPTIRELGSDLYRLALVFSYVGMIVSMIVTGLKIAWASPRNVTDLWSTIGWKMLVFFLTCSFANFAGLFGMLLTNMGQI